jgi:lactobin A/cerein 7B family class IIb bacteriocin
MSFETLDTNELNTVNGGLGPILSGLLGGALQGAGGAIASGQIGNGGILKGLLSGGLQGAAGGIQALGAGQGKGQPQPQGQPQGGGE